MKNPRRLAAMAAALCICGCMTACGSSSDSSSSAPAPTEAATEAPATTAEPTTEEVTTTKKVTTQKPTETPTEAPTEAESSGFSRGMRIGNMYQSITANFRFNAPDGWGYATDEEILSYVSNNNPRDAAAASSADEYFTDKTPMVVDAIAYTNQGFPRISFTFANRKSDSIPDADAAQVAQATYNSQVSKGMAVGELKTFSLGNDVYYYFTSEREDSNGTIYSSYVFKDAGKYVFEINAYTLANNFEDYIPYFECISENSLW